MVTVVLYMVRFPIDLVSHLASPCLTSKLSYRAFFLPPSLPYLSFSLPLVLALRARFCFFSRVRLHREPLRCVPRAREYVCIYRSHVCVSESANVCAPLSFLRATHTWCVKSCWWRWRWQLSACWLLALVAPGIFAGAGTEARAPSVIVFLWLRGRKKLDGTVFLCSYVSVLLCGYVSVSTRPPLHAFVSLCDRFYIWPSLYVSTFLRIRLSTCPPLCASISLYDLRSTRSHLCIFVSLRARLADCSSLYTPVSCPLISWVGNESRVPISLRAARYAAKHAWIDTLHECIHLCVNSLSLYLWIRVSGFWGFCI